MSHPQLTILIINTKKIRIFKEGFFLLFLSVHELVNPIKEIGMKFLILDYIDNRV